jgi:hypothetical protein
MDELDGAVIQLLALRHNVAPDSIKHHGAKRLPSQTFLVICQHGNNHSLMPVDDAIEDYQSEVNCTELLPLTIGKRQRNFLWGLCAKCGRVHVVRLITP